MSNIQKAASESYPSFNFGPIVLRYEIDHRRELVREVMSGGVTTFDGFYDLYGFFPPKNLIEVKVPIRCPK